MGHCYQKQEEEKTEHLYCCLCGLDYSSAQSLRIHLVSHTGKNTTDFSNAGKNRTDFGNAGKNRTDFGDAGKNRTDFGNARKNRTDFGCAGSSSSAFDWLRRIHESREGCVLHR
jgi:hypothetical protein